MIVVLQHHCKRIELIVQKLQVLVEGREGVYYPLLLPSYEHHKHQDGCKTLTNGLGESITSR